MKGRPISEAPRDGTVIIASIMRVSGVLDTGHYSFARINYRTTAREWDDTPDWHPVDQDHMTYGESCFIAWWPDGTPEGEMEQRPRTNFKWRPCNGDDGEYFRSRFCDRCVHDHEYQVDETRGKPCEILSMTMVFDIGDPGYPEQWTDRDGEACCTKFQLYRELDEQRNDQGELILPTPRCPETSDLFGGSDA